MNRMRQPPLYCLKGASSGGKEHGYNDTQAHEMQVQGGDVWSGEKDERAFSLRSRWSCRAGSERCVATC